jgi:hypothetical protein
MYFPHAFKKTFLLPDSAVSFTDTTTSALTAGQLNIYYGVTNGGITSGAVSAWASVGSATESAVPFYIVQGSYFTNDKIGPVHGGYKESIKSKLINPKYISRVIKVSAKSPLQNVVKVPVSCGISCDTTTRLRIDAKGSPALRFLSHNMYRVLDAYSGCCSTTDPTLQKDPVDTLLKWKDQINTSPIFNTMVQARVYKYATSATSSGYANNTATSTDLTIGSNTNILVGMKAVGGGLPANAFVTTVTSGTAITVSYPNQGSTVTPVNGAITFWTDCYSSDTNIAGNTSGSTPTIPGTSAVTAINCSGSTVSSGTLTGGTLASSNSGALIISSFTDAASFSYTAGQEPHIELTAAYVETKFGSCTFTPTDKFDLEPLTLITSVVDESGDPCSSNCFTTTYGTSGINTSTISQYPVQAMGTGETVLREMILSDRYMQIAFPDSGRVESLRMREIESNPALANISRIGLYDQVLVLHSVPRFNNPTGTFDNDQYLLVFYVPTGRTTTALTNFLVRSANLAQYGSATTSGTFQLESY